MSAVIDTLRATLQAAPDSWQCRLALVEALVAEERDEEATEVLREIAELPVDLEERTHAGRAYGLVAPESGLEVLDGVLSEDPALARAHIEKARILSRLDRPEKAKQHYYTAASISPDLADARFEKEIGVTESLVKDSAPAEPAASEEATESAEAVAETSVAETPVAETSVAETPVAETPVAETSVEGLPETEAPIESYEEAAPGTAPDSEEAPPEFAEETVEAEAPQPEPAAELPVIPLREALGLPKAQPLIDPDAVPEPPPLAYDPVPAPQEPVHLPEEVWRENLHPVELHPQSRPEPVVYDYRAPDDSIFEHAVTEEDILVGAPRESDGRWVDDLLDNLNASQKEQAEKIASTERRDKANSFVVATIAMAALCFLMVFVATSLPPPPPPQIIARTPLPSQEDMFDEQQLNKPELQKQPMASPASAMSMDVVSVSSYSEVSMPTFDSPGMSPGMASLGSDFGMSMSFGETGGGGAMFFGGRSSGQRFLFVLDHSASMKPNQIKLRNQELERTLKSLRGVRYHVMLFAGGIYFVDKGWAAKKKQPTKYPTVFESPGGDYKFEENGLFDFKLVGKEEDFPAPRWLTATPSNVRRSLESVKEAKQFGGTDWDTALKIAHLMDPPPDVIFFMSDGHDRQMDPSQIVRNSRGNGAPKINCIAMQTTAGIDEFAEIARRTNGSFKIVDKDGEPIDGFEYKKNPKKFADRL